MFENRFSVPYYGLDARWRVKPGTLLDFLQEAAARHANSLNIGVGDLLERGMTWVLRRYRVNVRFYPGRGDITVRTWFEPRRNLMSVRVFEILDDSGAVAADAWSAWIVLDLKRGRPVRLDRALPGDYFDAAEPTGDEVSDTIEAVGGDFALEQAFQISMSELDLNGHANHTAYFGWAMETAPDGVAERMSPMRLDAEFVQSARRSDGGVIARTKKISDTPLRLAHAIFIAGNDSLAAKLETLWR